MLSGTITHQALSCYAQMIKSAIVPTQAMDT